MMIPTFSGNSRRRNVNLSGRNNVNFMSAWAPSSGFGTLDALAKADEKRKRRHLDKRKLEAAKTLQKTWRGYRVRSQLLQSNQETFDRLYSSIPLLLAPLPPHFGANGKAGTQLEHANSRLQVSISLLIKIFSPRWKPKAAVRAVRVAQDVAGVGIDNLKSLCSPAQAYSLHKVFIGAAHILQPSIKQHEVKEEREQEDASNLTRCIGVLLQGLNITAQHLDFVHSLDLSGHYQLLSSLTSLTESNDMIRNAWFTAIRLPLDAVQSGSGSDYTAARTTVYRNLLFDLLTSPSTKVTRGLIKSAMTSIDVIDLSSIVNKEYSGKIHTIDTNGGSLWLAAHLIMVGFESDILRTQGSLMPAILTLIGGNVRSQVTDAVNRPADIDNSGDLEMVDYSDSNEDPPAKIPDYVQEKLDSLTTQSAIEYLIQGFNANAEQTPTEVLMTINNLAGYMLRLIHRFPERRDDIFMCLFLSDVKLGDGTNVPFLQNLLSIILRTSLFEHILSGFLEPVAALKDYLRETNNRSSDFVTFMVQNGRLNRDKIEAEWRVILLALDVYSFVLRLTDDDDFFTRLGTPNYELKPDTPRIQRCNLALSEISQLSKFLCQISFPLYNNVADLQQTNDGNERPAYNTSSVSSNGPLSIWDLPAAGPSTRNPTHKPKESQDKTLSLKLDMQQIKTIVTTALNVVYERDSRRRFLPQDHWLMTDKFDMSGFVTDVVLESERQQTADEDETVEDEIDHRDFFSTFSHGHARWVRASAVVEQQLAARNRKMRRERIMAAMGPRLEVLRHMPFVIPFDVRVQVLRKFIQLDKVRVHNDASDPALLREILSHDHDRFVRGRPVEVQRGDVFETAYADLAHAPSAMKNPMSITFVDQFGEREDGIDGGGVGKEFLISVTNEAFGEKQFFSLNSQNQYYPDSSQFDWYMAKAKDVTTVEERQAMERQMRNLLARYEFIGAIIGKCIYDATLIDVSFAGFFLRKWILGLTGPNAYKGTINDLCDLDEQTYQGLVALKQAADASELDFDFTINDKACLSGQPATYITHNLIPDGDKVTVTNSNRLLYVSYFARHRLVSQSAAITQAFLRGLWSIIKPSWISMFNQWELQRLVGGDSASVDLEDWRANTEYSGIYVVGDDGVDHPVIIMFWEILEEFSEKQRRLVLQYATSVPRAPLLGFSQLNPRFTIRDSIGSVSGRSQDRLPSASTCMNLLKLPSYESKEIMKSKLLYAIESGSGFGLS